MKHLRISTSVRAPRIDASVEVISRSHTSSGVAAWEEGGTRQADEFTHAASLRSLGLPPAQCAARASSAFPTARAALFAQRAPSNGAASPRSIGAKALPRRLGVLKATMHKRSHAQRGACCRHNRVAAACGCEYSARAGVRTVRLALIMMGWHVANYYSSESRLVCVQRVRTWPTMPSPCRLRSSAWRLM